MRPITDTILSRSAATSSAYAFRHPRPRKRKYVRREYGQPQHHLAHLVERINFPFVLCERRNSNPCAVMRVGQPGHRFRHRVTNAARKRDLGQIEPEPGRILRGNVRPVVFNCTRCLFSGAVSIFFSARPLSDTFDPGAPQFHQTAQPLAAQHVVQIGNHIETAQIAPQSQQAGHSLVPPFQIGLRKSRCFRLPGKTAAKFRSQTVMRRFG